MFKKIPFHPILFAIYPVLILYMRNLSMLEINLIFIPVIFTLLTILAMWGVLNLLIKNKYKSSIITSIFFLLFFSYGHLISLVGNYIEKALGIDADVYVSI